MGNKQRTELNALSSRREYRIQSLRLDSDGYLGDEKFIVAIVNIENKFSTHCADNGESLYLFMAGEEGGENCI